MPELPEVETVCWRLREGGHGEPPLLGRRLDTIEILDAKVLRSGDIDAVHGARVVGIRRRAKWIVIDVAREDDDDVVRQSLLLHLRMTGDLHVRRELPARFVRFVCTLDSGALLVFTDPRRFGTLDVVDDITPHIDELGPEPLDDAFTPAVLAKQLKGKRAIKATLLAQDVVAGLGNIYADEALFLANIHPETSTSSLTAAQVERLHAGIQRALRESIAAARTELAWRYENKSAPSPFRVYDRGGEPCVVCSTALSSTTIGGRTSVWCERCQPRP
jgi:formamidopyrimidine-DNA glycosylase